MTPIEIENYFKSRLIHPFPSRDCRWLAERTCIDPGDLIPELDLYDSNIAGYASSATTLFKRSSVQFDHALPSLQKGIGTKFPAWSGALKFVTEHDTPDLYARLEALEVLRVALIQILEPLVFATKGTK